MSVRRNAIFVPFLRLIFFSWPGVELLMGACVGNLFFYFFPHALESVFFPIMWEEAWSPEVESAGRCFGFQSNDCGFT